MATYTFTSAPDNSSDATFRTWIQALHTAITTLGWVQTSDTGQLDFTTATRPLSAGTIQGYRIYRMADSLQATSPCYLKLGVGSGGNLTGTAGIYIQIGTGTNGAMTLTGNTSTLTHNAGASNFASATPFNCFFSGDTGRMTAYMWADSGLAVVWNISRTVDTAGARTGDGIITMFNSNMAAWGSQLVGKQAGGIGNPAATAATAWSGVLPVGLAQCAGVEGFGIYPHIPSSGRPLEPCFDYGILTTADVPTAGCISFTAGGNSYKWLRTSVVLTGVYVYALRYD